MNTFATYRANPAVTEFWDSTISKLADPVDPAFIRDFQASTLAQPVPSAFFDRVVRESRKVPARVWKAVFQGFLATDLTTARRAIAAPTLILWGERDAYTPRSEQDVLATAIPGAELVVYHAGGHALHWEEPRRFASESRGLRRADSRTPGPAFLIASVTRAAHRRRWPANDDDSHNRLQVAGLSRSALLPRGRPLATVPRARSS